MPSGVLGLAAELGLSGVLFELTPFSSFRDAYLAKVRGAAEEKGLYVEFGMGSVLHWHPMAEKGRQLLAEAGCDVGVSDAQIVIRHLQVAKKLGSPILRVVAGNLFTRDEGHDMVAMADQVVAILREACRAAEDFGMKIAMETHADFTVRELASILARVDSPAFGFTVDTAQPGFRSGRSVAAGRNPGPARHYDALQELPHYPDGPRAGPGELRLGDGEIDVAAIARLLAKHNPQINLNIEIHTQFAPFRLDILKPAYWTRHPSPPGDGLAWYLAKAWGKTRLDPWPASLPDGPAAWQREADDIRASVRWAKHELADVLTT